MIKLYFEQLADRSDARFDVVYSEDESCDPLIAALFDLRIVASSPRR